MKVKKLNKKLAILLEGDPILKIPCEPIEEVTTELQTLAFNMCSTMIRSEGIGLAANQIGRSIQLLVVDTIYNEMGGVSAIMFNPKLLKGEGSITTQEGCLSLPNKRIEVERYSRIEVEYTNIQNKCIIREFKGLAAIAIQHELDHLQGITLSDKEQK